MRTWPTIGRDLATIVEAAAEVILPFWRTELDVVRKADESPVTEADKAGERLILARLAERFPEIPAISEEHASEFGTPDAIGPRFFLVDPVDGTKAFVRGDPNFTVNIGLIDQGVARGRRHLRPGDRRGLVHQRRRRDEARGAGRRPRPRSGRGLGRGRGAGPGQPHHEGRAGGRAGGPVRLLPARARWTARSSWSASPRARPTSIRAMGRPWSGTPPPVTPSWSPPAAASPRPRARPSPTARPTRASANGWFVARGA